VALSAEHGTIGRAEPSDVGYSDTTVHLHEKILMVRDVRIEAL
jgi:hypothetical protein